MYVCMFVCMYRFNSGNSAHKKKSKNITSRQMGRQTKANYIYKLQAKFHIVLITLHYIKFKVKKCRSTSDTLQSL